MSETTTQGEPSATAGFRGNLEQTHLLLKLTYGLVPIVAGLDKFTNLLASWSEFLPAAISGALPVEPMVFMYVVGVIEIIAGVLVLTKYTEYAAYVVAGWLVAVALTQILAGNYTIAVRDVVMAVGAVALAQLDVMRNAS